MKRFIGILPVFLILLAGCQKEEAPAVRPGTATKTQASAVSYDPDAPIVYFATEADYVAWTHINTLMKRFEACEPPQKQLNAMTTEALAKSVMNYPLNYLTLFYENSQVAIDLIIENSSLHRAFLSRSDAGKVLVPLYAAAELDMSLEKSNHDGDYGCLSYTNSMFLDYFIGSGRIPGLDDPSVRKQLIDAVEKKISYRESQPEIFSWYSIAPLYDLREMLAAR